MKPDKAQSAITLFDEIQQQWQSNGLGNLTVEEMISFNRWVAQKERELVKK